MKWDAEKIRSLRNRMGWSQSDLARRLNCQLSDIQLLETANHKVALQQHTDALVILERQAEEQSGQVVKAALAEVMMEEIHCDQIDSDAVERRFQNSN